jgi:hypothetical protein
MRFVDGMARARDFDRVAVSARVVPLMLFIFPFAPAQSICLVKQLSNLIGALRAS